MTSIITRRNLLRSLFAAPAVIAASSLMPISARNLIDDPWYELSETSLMRAMIEIAEREHMRWPALKIISHPTKVVIPGWGGVTLNSMAHPT